MTFPNFWIARAKWYIRRDLPIPIDIYAKLDAEGVDINELERTTRNERTSQ